MTHQEAKGLLLEIPRPCSVGPALNARARAYSHRPIHRAVEESWGGDAFSSSFSLEAPSQEEEMRMHKGIGVRDSGGGSSLNVDPSHMAMCPSVLLPTVRLREMQHHVWVAPGPQA